MKLNKMKELNKKTTSILIITILMLSMIFAGIPNVTAVVAPPALTPGPYLVGTEVTVSGMDATPGGLIKVYWDSVKPWDGTAGFLAEGYAVGPDYSIAIIIPKAVAGDHWVIVKDVEAANIVSTTLLVSPEIKLNPIAGVVEDTITVTGKGFASTEAITIYGIPLVDSVIPTVPIAVTTSALGSFTCTFKIPVATPDATYTITAKDTAVLPDLPNEASTPLKVGTVIKLTPDSGLVGTTVTVEGRGFTYDGKVDIRWYIIPGTYVTLVNDYKIGANGEFSTTFTVPLVADPSPPFDEYTVEAVDSGLLETTAIFTVVDEASITLIPDEGRPEDTFTVSGTWFTASSTVEIILDGTVLVTDIPTDGLGEFTAAGLNVPDLDPRAYTVTATDAKDVYATGTYTILPPPSIVIETRETEYLPGDTVSFYIRSTTDVYVLEIKVKDPTDYLFVTLTPTLISMNGWYGVEYDKSSFVLPSDYEDGIWTWTATNTLPEPDVELATGVFTVGEVEEPEPEPVTDISLSVGWNLVSLPLIPDDSSIEVVLAGLVGVKSVWTYDAGIWYSYSPGAPSDLTEMVDGEGYWMSMTASATLSVTGTEMPVDPFDHCQLTR